MKLIIDIDDNVYDDIEHNKGEYINTLNWAVRNGIPYEGRPQSKWIVTAEDDEGVHRILCPFCGYEKGTDFIDYIIVTFEKMPPFCENCGAELKGGAE